MSEPTWPEKAISKIEPEDVLWVMDWSGTKEDGTRKYPNKPEQEEVFEAEKALAILLINEVIFLNSHWWEHDWPEDARHRASLNVNCNDVFAWGCADAESANYRDIEEIYRLWLKWPNWGGSLWCMIKRNQMPQSPILKAMKKEGIPVDEIMAEHRLRHNHYDGVSNLMATMKYEAYCTWERVNGDEPLPFDTGWWKGWERFVKANPDWRTKEWEEKESAARSAWRVENGYEKAS